ncbi:PREDICTED: uncharacterized protein LOC106752095 [Dinoponera quadriceps]|uniref:Uncharacterized protein LOC106752095 n=1 Tax=Dinoponera quadriceps TaxID=609295 RepID=A0A6P3YD86_DINQU|nr:PREDICTED: uncharacterized protein LOC106752095 [Dinoponera quadriceps]
MKEHGNKHPAEPATKTLKSLLKKPGQTKAKSQKHRVVINEKLNEFFAADYIILIKEECCADYEEDCDCCYQEHEFMRLGNCKECRAELNLHFGIGNGRYGGELEEEEREDEEEDEEKNGKVERVVVAAAATTTTTTSVEGKDANEREDAEDAVAKGRRPKDSQEENGTVVPPPPPPPPRHEQQETLSPPEGYKDVCSNNEIPDEPEQRRAPAACTECNYYQQQAAECESQAKDHGNEQNAAQDSKDSSTAQDGCQRNLQERLDKQQQQHRASLPDLHHRYLVETITMTTVTERRIVREISEEERKDCCGRSDTDKERNSCDAVPKDNGFNPALCPPTSEPATVVHENASSAGVRCNEPVDVREDRDGGEAKNPGGDKREPTEEAERVSDQTTAGEQEAKELSLVFKLGNVSLASNSLKPNSAVRQLFPNPKFISPPPAPHSQDEAQKFLITAESLRLFEAVKKTPGGSYESPECESGSIKRSIERNTLRRSLIGKYSTISRKAKSARPKNLSLEERIRQLTCVDQEEEGVDTTDSSDNAGADLPIRTSPLGEERPMSELPSAAPTETTATLTMVSTRSGSLTAATTTAATTTAASATVTDNPPNQSTYRKITDLFAHKKNLPDLGIGGRNLLAKECQSKNPLSKMNSDVRRQLLASLAPLSCVAISSADNQDDYYRGEPPRILASRESIGYNSDSSYSLEDIEAVLNGEDGKYAGQPDVTKCTPVGSRPDIGDNSADELLAFVEQDKPRMERIKRRYNDAEERHSFINGYHTEDKSVNTDGAEEDDEDDELNDYGFNRRPSVTGIKQQYEANESVGHRARPAVNNFARSGSMVWPPPVYDVNGEKDAAGDGDEAAIGSFERDTNTINRINTMQRQIDDIYQTIAESTANLDGAAIPPRQFMQRRNPAVTIANYHCNVQLPSGAVPVNTKCYRTMYFVPYSGMSDPTYQNIQRILPPHSSPNYASHIERYPYPRLGKTAGQQQALYYTAGRSAASPPVPPPPPPVHHPHQPGVAFSPHHPVQFHHHHHEMMTSYRVPTPPSYTVIAPSRCVPASNQDGYPLYQAHLGRGGVTAADVQTQTISLPGVKSCEQPSLGTSFGANGSVSPLACSAATSSTVVSSATVMQLPPRAATCALTERGAPEGAASMPARDFQQSAAPPHVLLVSNSYVDPGSLVPTPTNSAPNTVYYAMNV